MEDPDRLLARIVAWVERDDRVEGVVQTGSRARGRRVDHLSDLDVELIGPDPRALADDDRWIAALGEVMVTLELENDEPGDYGWPTRLVVFDGGRKVDFLLGGWSRIDGMVEAGLDGLYDHGYRILLDKTGRLARLPSPRVLPPEPVLPSQEEFGAVESEFWFEATQIPVYLARRDLWVVKFREHTMHQCLLRMLEWSAQSDPEGPRHTWHLGHHLDEWLPERWYAEVRQVFTHADPEDTLRGLEVCTSLFAEVSAVVADRLGLVVRGDLPDRVRRHRVAVLASVTTES